MNTRFTDPKTLSSSDLESGSALAPRFDADGLITAIAQEAETGNVLMLAFMNAEALRLTLETKEVHYFSRSRSKIWKKGESSGQIQKLREVRVDCDQDAVLLTVEQTGHGAACHTGRKSCFYRRVQVENGAYTLVDTGDEKLFDPAKVYNK